MKNGGVVWVWPDTTVFLLQQTILSLTVTCQHMVNTLLNKTTFFAYCLMLLEARKSVIIKRHDDLCAYDKEYYMRKDITWHCNCKQLAFLLPLASWRGRIIARKFPVLTILFLVRPTVQSESAAQLGRWFPQHNTAIVKWPGVNQAPLLWCCPQSTLCPLEFPPQIALTQVTTGAGDANFHCRPGSWHTQTPQDRNVLDKNWL